MLRPRPRPYARIRARPASLPRAAQRTPTTKAIMNRALRQPPEVALEAELVEDRLVLFSRVRSPRRRETVVPPRVRELAELRDRDRGSGLASSEPACDVLFRPEEIHGASRE